MMDVASLTDKAEFVKNSLLIANFSEVVKGVSSGATMPTSATLINMVSGHIHMPIVGVVNWITQFVKNFIKIFPMK